MTRLRVICRCGHEMDIHSTSTVDPFCNMGRCLAVDRLGFACCRCEYFDEVPTTQANEGPESGQKK